MNALKKPVSILLSAVIGACLITAVPIHAGAVTKETAVSILGDVNLDGKADISDATVIQTYLTESIELSPIALRLADVNRDGNVTIDDVTDLQRYLADLPSPEGIGEPIEDTPASPIEHKLLQTVKTSRIDYETQEWEPVQTTTITYENAYPVQIETLDNYEDAEPALTTISYTFDGDIPKTRTETDAANNSITTVEYRDGRVYNSRTDTGSSGTYLKKMYQYGHGDDYFTMVLHEGFISGEGFGPDERKEEADSVSVSTENGLLKSTTNTGIYAKWLEGQEKRWVRFRGVYTADYDENGIVNHQHTVFSDIGFQEISRFEVTEKNGIITEIVKYTASYDNGWQPYEKYEFTYADTEINAARYASMINYFVAEHGGNFYIYNWY